jgi:polysaccharide deacetylase 2 family uncharacterized protein YibQ
VATDDLNAPLGLKKKQAQFRVPPYTAVACAGVLGLLIASFAISALFNSDPLGGEPMATVKIDLTADAGPPAERKPIVVPKAENPPPQRPAGPSEGGAAAKPPSREQLPVRSENGPPEQAGGRGEQIVTIIDGKSGARQEVKIPSSSESGTFMADSQLVEMTKNGPIPRVGADGLRAAQAYAQPISSKPNSPQIAIVMTGLGISASGTADAINKLPGPVTFAFAPYGVDLERIAAKAHSLGHELLLQIPMEPFDYPENDPGPQTLTTAATPEQNIERLQWAMSRFQGYVGVSNQMGARFTASEASFSPIMREISKRGLIYVDDGNSPRSLASQIAGGNRLAFAKANLVLDTVPSAVEIDRALVRLEGMARENGIAVAVAAALPVTIERIAIWAKTAENRGFTLAPISAAAMRAKSS